MTYPTLSIKVTFEQHSTLTRIMNQPLVLANRYQILHQLGSGGFGETFLAKDTYLPSQRSCVIKQLKPINDDPDLYQIVQERFQREAVTLEDLGEHHHQIPKLYAYFEEQQKFYLVQEYIEGQTLDSLVQQGGKQDEETVKTILRQLLEILEYIETKGIIHRDLKPDNIILRHSDGLPVLIDFGAVRETMATVMSPSGKGTKSIVIGTPGFMPPEQTAGRPVFSSDLYALGLTMIYLLTAKAPQEFATDPLTGEILWHSEASNISQSLQTLLNQAVKAHCSERFPTAKVMRDALEGNTSASLLKSPVQTTTVSDPPPANLPKKSHVSTGRIATVAGIGTLVMGVGIISFISLNEPASDPVSTVSPESATAVESPTPESAETQPPQQESSALQQQQEELERQLAQQQEILAEQQRQIEQQQQQLRTSQSQAISSQSSTSQPQRGMWVVKVNPNSEADQAGMKTRQILISLNGVYVDRVEIANSIVGQNVNRPIQARVWENGTVKELSVTPTDQYMGVTLCQFSNCPNGYEP